MTVNPAIRSAVAAQAYPYDYWWNGYRIAVTSSGWLILADDGLPPDARRPQAARGNPSLIPFQIRRYYQAFDVSTVAPPAGDNPVDRARPQAFIVPGSAVPYRIGRYYQQFDVSTPAVADAVVDRVRPQPIVTPSSAVPYRIGRYYQAFDVSTPAVADPVVDRVRPQPFVPSTSSVPYRIGRYYSSPVDVINTVTEPTDRGSRRPYTPVAPSVANRIQRYYVPQIIDVVGDQPSDRLQPRARARADVSRYALAVRRYYQVAPPDEILGVPGIVTVIFSGATTTTRFQSTASMSVTLA